LHDLGAIELRFVLGFSLPIIETELSECTDFTWLIASLPPMAATYLLTISSAVCARNEIALASAETTSMPRMMFFI